MGRVLVIGGGWAGCAAALTASRLGATVTLLERSDMLLGTGLVGGIYRNNGRQTAVFEAETLGCGELFALMDQVALHHDLDFPGHKHASLYDVTRAEPLVRKLLAVEKVDLRLQSRAADVSLAEDRIIEIILENEEVLPADAFVEATGTAGGMSNCGRFGNGCVMCIIRCPTFGPRVSIAAKAGILELMGIQSNGRPGSFSGSCKLHKDSLAPALREELEAKGLLVIPLPQEIRNAGMAKKACQQYNLPAYEDNLIILNTGHAKLMTSFLPLEQLRSVPGLENARYEDPYSGGVGNSVRFTAIPPRDNRLKVEGLDNLFCAGEKAGFIVGHTEAVITGTLAGFNAAALAGRRELITLPGSLACGDLIDYAKTTGAGKKKLINRITFSGAEYFTRMQEHGLYSTDKEEVRRRVEATGLAGVFGRPAD